MSAIVSNNAMTTTKKTYGVIIPYECMNLIFEYLSHLLDSKSRLTFDLDGRIRLRNNQYCKLYAPVSNIFDYKSHIIHCCNMGGQYVPLEIRFESTNTILQVDALQQYRSIVDQSDYNANIAAGFILFGVCYTYYNPLVGEREVIYVDLKAEVADDSEFTFIRGTLHKSSNASSPMPISDNLRLVENLDFVDDGSVRVTVPNMEMGMEMEIDWIVDLEGDPGLEHLENEFEPLFGFDELEAEIAAGYI